MPSPTIIKATMEAGKDIARNVNTKAHTGEVFHDNAIHMKMFGGKGIDVIPDHKGALLQVSGLGARGEGGLTINMDKQEYNKFISLTDYRQRKSFVEDFIKQHSLETYNKLMGSEINDLNRRVLTHTPYTSDGVGIRYKEDMDRDRFLDINKILDPLNSRIKNPDLHGNAMTCEIDGIPQVITIHSQRALDAYNNGKVSLNQLANAVLKSYDNQQMALQGQVEMGLNAQRGQDQSQSMGMRR